MELHKDYYNKKKKELNDVDVVKGLIEATNFYMDGEVLECRYILAKIVNAIDKFTNDFDF